MKNLIIYSIAIIFIVVIALFIGTSIPNGERVTVQGNVYYNALTGWGITVAHIEVEHDTLITLYLPWETKDVVVVGKMGEYTAEVGIGTLSNIIGSKTYSLVFRGVEEGFYHGTIEVYEVEKLIGLETSNRILRAQTTFTVEV